jgi:hypothetical protein
MTAPAEPTPDPAAPSRRDRRWAPPAWAVGAVGVLAVVAFLAGFASSSRGSSGPEPTRTPTSAFTFPPLPPASTGVLTLLQHRPLAIDRPAIPTGSLLVQTSFRLVDAGSIASLYVARSVGGDVCLVAVTADQQFASTCAAPRHVQRVALELRFTVVTAHPVGRISVLARLDPDGIADLKAVPKQ